MTHEDEIQRRCQQYLLNELDDAQTEAFESQIAASAEVRAVLAQQADMLATLGETCLVESNAKLYVADIHLPLRRIAVVLLSLAALFLLIFQYSEFLHNQDSHGTAEPVALRADDDQVQVAEAWASNRTRLGDRDTDEFAELMSIESALDESTEVPSWLALGVAQSLESEAASSAQGDSREKS